MSYFQKLFFTFFLVLIFSCTSLKYTTYYSESKYPIHLENVQLSFLNDSLVEIKSSDVQQTFKYQRLGNNFFKIKRQSQTITPFNYLTEDTCVVYRHQIFYFSDSVKLVFNRKIQK